MAMLASVSAAPAIATAAFEPGQWQHRTIILNADVPGIPQWLIKLAAGHGTRKSCNSQAEMISHPEELLKGDDSAVCRLRKLSLAGGKITYNTFCTNKHFPDGLLVSSHGTYTPISYSISTISTGMRNGKPVRITTQGSGQRVSGACGNS
ncbi:DUF3617 domain-containing protein [Sphingomonas oryzagri]